MSPKTQIINEYRDTLSLTAKYIGLQLGYRYRRGLALKEYKPLVGIKKKINNIKDKIINAKNYQEILKLRKELEQLWKRYEEERKKVEPKARPHLDMAKKIKEELDRTEKLLKEKLEKLGFKVVTISEI